MRQKCCDKSWSLLLTVEPEVGVGATKTDEVREGLCLASMLALQAVLARAKQKYKARRPIMTNASKTGLRSHGE